MHGQCLMAGDGASLAGGVAVGAAVVGMLLIGLPAIDLVAWSIALSRASGMAASFLAICRWVFNVGSVVCAN